MAFSLLSERATTRSTNGQAAIRGRSWRWNGGAIRGFATVHPVDEEPDSAELRALYVHPDHWRRGIGRALLGEAQDLWIRQHVVRAALWLLVGNRRGELFYRSNGWVPDGIGRQDKVWGVLVDEIRLVRQLSSSPQGAQSARLTGA